MAEISTKKIGRFTVTIDRFMALEGLIVYLFGLAIPVFLPGTVFNVYNNISAALITDSVAELLLAAVKLVVANVGRMIPHYLGAFIMNESLHIRYKNRGFFLFNVLGTYLLIYLMYQAIYWVYGIRLDFGTPALLTVAFTLYLSYLNLFEVRMLDKIILLFSLLMSIQWLDIVPGITGTGFGFGRGEVSEDVKMVAEILDGGRALKLFSSSMIVAFGLMTFIQIRLLIGEHKLKISNEERSQVQKHLYETQIEALKMRNTTEAQTLVHDLKSPLTTVQGLVSLAQMMEENPLIQEYFEKITTSLNNMSTMISEILYENKEQTIPVKDLFHTVLAQVSIRIPREMLSSNCTCETALIRCNKIRLTRAIVNLLDNARHAVDPKTGKIQLNAEEKDGRIVITVRDNGCGMSLERLSHIYDVGYSGRGSSGMGLAFVKQVVDHLGGSLSITSWPEEGTLAIITLKKVENNGDNEENSGD